MLSSISEIISVMLVPSGLLVVALVVAPLALYLSFVRTALLLSSIAAIGFLAFGFGPLGNILARPLENRFPVPSQMLRSPAGIIVLGGAIDPVTTTTRHSIALTGSAGRMTEAVRLALLYPDSRLIFTGGSPGIDDPEHDEAAVAGQLFAELGVQSGRATLERKSRNTFENAIFTRDLVQPKPGEVWLLVTSAIHMPRAVGTFRKAGFFVLPYPTDYLTRGDASDFWHARTDFSAGLQTADAATHEMARSHCILGFGQN